MQDKVFYVSCIGFTVGVLVASFVFLDLSYVLFLSLLSFVLILFFNFISSNKWGIVLSIFLFAISLGLLRFNMIPSDAPLVFQDYIGEKTNFYGKLIDTPDIRENNQKLIVQLMLGEEKTKALITTDFISSFDYGDGLEIYGKLEKPENFITDQGKYFDYINYLKKDGIFFVMSYPTIEKVSQKNGNPVKQFLFSIKNRFVENINFSIRNPESILMSGLILGEKSSFNQELRQNFIDTGTIHIVALSGYNVTLIAEWIMKLFSVFPMNIGLSAGIFTIFLFVLMTGASSTAIRAGIMASLALFARIINRNYDITRSLFLAGVLMILINPLILVFDISFQLSFIATVAVIYLSPKMERYFLWVTKVFNLRDIISVTVSAYVFVLPFILYKMGNLSLVALPANFLVLPFIQPTMILGFLTGFLGFVSHVLSAPFGFISYLFLHYELFVVNFLAEIPLASIVLSDFPLFVAVLIYSYFIYKLFGRSIKSFFQFSSN